MAENNENNELDLEEQLKRQKEKRKKFWLLTLPTILVYLFCFLLFPGFIVYTVLNSNYNLITGNERNRILEKSKQRLNTIEKYCTTNKYFHQLFTEIFNRTEKADNPKEYLAENIHNLKDKYKDGLEFIVWDENGEIIKELTDKKKYYYAMKKTYGVLDNVSNVIQNNPKANLTKIKSVNTNINTLRTILGRIFIPEHLKKPYLHGENSGALLTELGEKYTSVWFKIGQKIGFLCYFAQDLMRSNTTLPKIVESLNKEKSEYICGYSFSYDYAKPVTEIPESLKNKVMLALSKFEGSGESIFEDESVIISISMPQPEIRAFCIYVKNIKNWSKQNRIDNVFYQITLLALLCYTVFYVFINYKQQFVSISWKLGLLFLIANIIPLSILGFISFNYLYSSNDAIYEETVEELKLQIKEFDERLSLQINDYELQLNEKFDYINENNGLNPIDKNLSTNIRDIAIEYKANESILVASSGEVIYHYKSNIDEDSDATFYKEFTKSVLYYCNNLKYIPENDMMKKALSPDNAEIVRNVYINKRKIVRFALGNSDKLTYSYIFGDSDNHQNNYLLYISWNDATFQTQYLNQYYILNSHRLNDISLYISSIDGKSKWPESNFPKAISKQMESINEFSDIKTMNLNIDDETYLTVISPGSSLNTMLISSTYPMEKITHNLTNTRNTIIICAIISMLLTTVIGKTLTKQFITPINNLQEATLAVSKQQYSHRIPILDEDEFGHLNEVFNRVISGLEDFETAQIIQKSLLPGNHFKLGQMRVYAQNIIMTTLGGDYYDVIKINDNHWGLVMGDVAGHGVSAGLMMAMAKAGILSSTEEEQMDPSVLTAKLHRMFFAIKNDKLKRMMTFQYLMVEPETNTFTFVNAGHCFPLIIHTKTKEAEFIEHVATPLGIGPRARYKNLKFTLEPGDSLILYTDGIAESKNDKGEEYTFERLRRNIPELYDPNPEVFYKNIYGLYDDWSAQPEDDYTVMVINNV